jgi:uncharacterized RDD family membrane protein YckC
MKRFFILSVFLLLGILISLIAFGIMNKRKANTKSLGHAGFWKRSAIHSFDFLASLFVIPVLFNLYFYFRDGQTLGDKIFGTRIVSLGNNELPSFWALVGRFFAQTLSAIPLYLGFFWMIWEEKNQTWHDKLASTIVIEEKQIDSYWVWSMNLSIPIVLIIIAFLKGYYSASF